MRAVQFGGIDQIDLVDLPIPSPDADQALVRVEVTALCGSELHGQSPPPNGGHEAAGIVQSAPEGSSIQAGDRVGISAVTGCGTCDWCRAGVQLHCRNGFHVQTGMHAEYLAVPLAALRKVPPGMSAEDAVLVSGDALGVPVRAARRVPAEANERVLVLGLGPIGLGHALVRAHMGAKVVAVEPSQYRRDLALTLGVSEVLTPEDSVGGPVNLVIECTGLSSVINQALDVVEPGGTVLQSGECSSVEINPSESLIRKELTYTGTWYYADEDVPELLRLYESGLRPSALVTHEFEASDAVEAFRTFASRSAGKVLIRWS